MICDSSSTPASNGPATSGAEAGDAEHHIGEDDGQFDQQPLP